MNKLVIRFKDGAFAIINCKEMHDNDGIIKVYDNNLLLVAVFDEKDISAAYISRKE